MARFHIHFVDHGWKAAWKSDPALGVIRVE